MKREDYNRAKEIFKLIDCLEAENSLVLNQIEAMEKLKSCDVYNERITLYLDVCCHPTKIVVTVEEFINLLNSANGRLTGRINELLQEFDEIGNNDEV